MTGLPIVGVPMAYTPATAYGTPTPTRSGIQWTLDGSNIVGATSATYTPVAGDATHALAVTETWANLAGAVVSTSFAQTVSAAAVAPTITTNAAIIGTPTSGASISYTSAVVTGVPTPTVTSRQWTLNGTNITGANGTTYTPSSGDVGGTLAIKETWTNSAGAVTSTSTAVAVVAGGASSELVAWALPTTDAQGQPVTITSQTVYWDTVSHAPFGGYANSHVIADGTSTSYTITGLSSGTTYYWTNTTTNANGESAFAIEQTFVAP